MDSPVEAEISPEEHKAAIEENLRSFIQDNPSSEVMQSTSNVKVHYLKLPWNDPSVIFVIFEDGTELGAALENLILPERLSALYHKDTRTMEIIFTAQRLGEALDQLRGREFDFRLRDKEHNCKFGDSTDRLMTIARCAAFPRTTTTGFRNLRSYSDYLRAKDSKDDEDESLSEYFTEPMSFFVNNIDWDEDETLDLLRHISFYLRYYDSVCPFVLIHPPADSMVVNPQTRYVQGDFPSKISSPELNPVLLSFWLAGADEEADLKFLQYFRIIEFVTSYYLAADKMNAVRRLIATPDLPSRIGPAVDSLVALIREDKPNPYERFHKVISDLVDDKTIWSEICANAWAFTQPVTFDGGYVQSALVANVDNINAFGPQGLYNMARHFRAIRNALAHGGEAQSGEVILPTAANLKRLQPWVHLIAVAAGQVVMLEHTT